MDWSEENILKLIDLYNIKPLLWDPNHKDYFKKNLKEDAWMEISTELDISVEQCKRKMMSLLASYRRERNKIKTSKDTAKGKSDIYVSRWFAYEAFKFLEDRDLLRRSFVSETDGVAGIEDDIEIEDVPSEQTEQEPTASSSTPKVIIKRKVDDIDSSVMKDSVVPPRPNEIDSFFTYVSTKVRKYSPEAQAAVQHAVFEVLMTADQGLFDPPAQRTDHKRHSNGSSSKFRNFSSRH